MQPLHPTRPTELRAALMENELLRYENRHLKARLSEAIGEFPPTPDDLTGDRPAAREQQAPAEGQGLAKEAATPTQQRAYDDIVWLVGRLDRSLVGPMLRRWDGFRTLRERYLSGEGS